VRCSAAFFCRPSRNFVSVFLLRIDCETCTDTSGTSQATYAFDAFGNLSGNPGSVVNPFRFAGEYIDSESGLYYLRARYYDPTTGQFVSRDSMLASTREPYAYAHNDPLDVTDPSGLCDWNPFAGSSCVGQAASAVSHAAGGAIQDAGQQLKTFAVQNRQTIAGLAAAFDTAATMSADIASACGFVQLISVGASTEVTGPCMVAFGAIAITSRAAAAGSDLLLALAGNEDAARAASGELGAAAIDAAGIVTGELCAGQFVSSAANMARGGIQAESFFGGNVWHALISQ